MEVLYYEKVYCSNPYTLYNVRLLNKHESRNVVCDILGSISFMQKKQYFSRIISVIICLYYLNEDNVR